MGSRRLLLLVLLLLAPWSGFAKEVPFLAGRVNDQANLLTPEQRQSIESKLAGLEQRTTAQVAVLTINSLEGDPIEDFSIRVVETWKLGTEKEDNGALLLVVKDDRKMRIEVGYGLEPTLTDLRTSVIQNDVIIPYFRRGDFGGGIEAGVDAIISTVEGKAVQPATPQEPRPRGGEGRSGWSPGFFVFLLFLLFPFSMDAIRSRSWVMYLFLMPFYFFLGSLLSPIVGMFALGAWIVGFPILRMITPKQPRGHRRRGGGGWFIGPGMGGGWGGGGGSWGGGGGGFSGGGGSFGGGGSSSSW